MGYHYDYRVRVGPEQLERLESHMDRIKRNYSDDAHIAFWAINVGGFDEKPVNTDGKVIYNEDGYRRTVYMLYYFVYDGGQEAKFLEEMSDELKDKYFRVALEDNGNRMLKYWKLYKMTELGVKEI